MTREYIEKIINENTNLIADGYYHATIVLNNGKPNERRIPALRGFLDEMADNLEHALSLERFEGAIFLVEVDEIKRSFATIKYTGRHTTFWVY